MQLHAAELHHCLGVSDPDLAHVSKAVGSRQEITSVAPAHAGNDPAFE